ncbi:hypothetical protein BDV11DRAFT_173848 [Aspergillus similis]
MPNADADLLHLQRPSTCTPIPPSRPTIRRETCRGGPGPGRPSGIPSGPRALILLGRRADALGETASIISSHAETLLEIYEVELCDGSSLRDVMKQVAADFGSIDILVHCAGSLAPVVPLLETDPATFLDGYKTTVVGTLATAQAVVLANKTVSGEERPVIFINLTTAGHPVPATPRHGRLLEQQDGRRQAPAVLRRREPACASTQVHPGFLETAMSAKLAEKVRLPYAYDDISLPADFLVCTASPEAEFLRDKIVFAAWDVDELKARAKEIVGESPGTGELWLAFQGFPRFMAGQPLPGTN